MVSPLLVESLRDPHREMMMILFEVLDDDFQDQQLLLIVIKCYKSSSDI